MENWYDTPQPEIAWLVDGLITSDGHAAIAGKPKAGKSTIIRNLIASIVKGRYFLGRRIEILEGAGKVLYVHLDRKDQPHAVIAELRQLGITREESSRIALRTSQDMPKESYEERLRWLQKETLGFQPQLIVIDLMWQFVVTENSNAYNKTLEGINQLQDALTGIEYKGALLVALHSRKSENPNDPADDMLGSTSQRGSFGTNIFVKRYRKEQVYTILTEQTIRDDAFGEIDETTILRNPDGTLFLGQAVSEMAKEAKKEKIEEEIQRMIAFVDEHPGCEMEEITRGLAVSKKKALATIGRMALIQAQGKGVKGDPYKYFFTASERCQDAMTLGAA